MPLPEMVREEYNAYRKTLLQFHLYEFIFKEASTSCEAMCDSTETPRPIFAEELSALEAALPQLVDEVRLVAVNI